MKPENPNEYDEGSFMRASYQLEDALHMLWEAGASDEDIEAEIANHLANARDNGWE